MRGRSGACTITVAVQVPNNAATGNRTNIIAVGALVTYNGRLYRARVAQLVGAEALVLLSDQEIGQRKEIVDPIDTRLMSPLLVPGAAATIGEMATRALKGAWFHKWIVNLRMRPEEYGALVQANRTGTNPFPQAAGALHSDVLNSTVLPIIHSTYGSYLMPQAYPEGSPTHPCYPTGHGTVAGACITMLKFFFDCTQKIRPLLLAAQDEDGKDLRLAARLEVVRTDLDGAARAGQVHQCGLHRDDRPSGRLVARVEADRDRAGRLPRDARPGLQRGRAGR